MTLGFARPNPGPPLQDLGITLFFLPNVFCILLILPILRKLCMTITIMTATKLYDLIYMNRTVSCLVHIQVNNVMHTISLGAGQIYNNYSIMSTGLLLTVFLVDILGRKFTVSLEFLLFSVCVICLCICMSR